MTGEFSVAVHALVFLYHKGATLTSGELAENICTNPARVRKVMASLVRAGVAHSSEGRGSGYSVLPDAGDTTLLQVLDAVGERAVDAAWRTGQMDTDCLISSGMGSVMDALCEDMNELCRKKLSGMTIGSINNMLTHTEGDEK